MNISDRQKTYAAFAEITRKWVTVMDAKAGFLSALNGALLTFMWSGAKLGDVSSAVRCFAVSASALALLALLASLWVIIPREKLPAIFGKPVRWSASYKPFSFYGFIASNYEPDRFYQLEAELEQLSDADFAQEALEQHFTISR